MPLPAVCAARGDLRARAVCALLAVTFLFGLTASTAGAAGPWSLLDAGTPIANRQVDDPATVELGVRFSVASTPNTTYQISSVRFYHQPAMGSNRVFIYGPGGAVLGSGELVASRTGVIEVQLAQPVRLSPGLIYTASYLAAGGLYAEQQHAFDVAQTAGPATFHAGVYAYGGGYPTSTWEASGYYVSPVIAVTAQSAPPPPPPPSQWALFNAGTAIANEFVDDYNRVEVGARFSVAQPAAGDYWADAVRFYLGPCGSMVETRVFLYDAGGQLVRSGVVIGEGGHPGFFEIALNPRVKLTPGMTYTATYLAEHGCYVEEQHGFDAPRVIGPLRFPAEAGVYEYGGGFPTNAWEATNYYVTPVVSAG
jgi:hypothetical protein